MIGIVIQLRHNSISTQKYAKKTFKMKIECQNTQHNDKYPHKYCKTMGIDNNGIIQVFYVIPAYHHAFGRICTSL